MTLPDLYRAARSLEAMENYTHADEPLLQNIKPTDEVLECDHTFDHDDEFWKSILLESTSKSGGECKSSGAFFFGFAVSEWVARVPGLFWAKGADNLRILADQAIQYESPKWTTLHPPGKSAKVLGGIGTMKFPPNERGYHLVTLSAGHNASSGIPVLVSPQVWEAHDISEGCVINLAAKWQPMAAEWACRFPSIKGIPKGYLIVENASQVHCVLARGQPTQIHPFTVMEYSRGNIQLFDFVYATADTGDQAYRAELESFFDFYKMDSGRYGRYLLSADISSPLWDADYDDPASLRSDSGAIAQLNLLEARVREESFKGHSLELILEVLVTNYDDESLKRLSDIVGLPRSQWYAAGVPMAALAARMLESARNRERVEVLIDAIALEYPNLFGS